MRWTLVVVVAVVTLGWEALVAAGDEGKQEKVVKTAKKASKPPNIVILVADDLGIGDVGCYGNTTIKTPNIDSLAKDGVQLTHHLSASPFCTPSRAALLTARYPARYGMVGERNAPAVVMHIASKVGLPLEEITLAKALRQANYTTAAVGKWHLGSGCGLLGRDCLGPHQHGFQHFYGLPSTLFYGQDTNQTFFHFPLDGSDPFYQILLTTAIVSVVTLLWVCGCRPLTFFLLCVLGLLLSLTWLIYTHTSLYTPYWWRVSPWVLKNLNGVLMEDGVVLEQPLVLEGLSQKLASHSAALIGQYAREEQPFFLFHSFPHVHVPMFTVPQMAGRSAHGRYGDNVEELDSSVGEILAALHEHKLEDNTIVYFLSDNGGHLEVTDERGQRTGGHNGLYKGGKGQGGSEGAIRVPGIWRWPGHIPAGVKVDAPVSLLDTLPTMLDLAGLPTLQELMPHLPHRELDGISVADVLTKGSKSPSRTLIHHCGREIHALRFVYEDVVYKMQLAGYRWEGGEGSTQCGSGYQYCSCFDVEDFTDEPRLYNLKADPYEDHPIPADDRMYTQMVGLLLQFLAEWRERVPYPPSMFSSMKDTVLSPWLQPFRITS